MLVENYSNSPGGQTYSAATRIFIGLRANVSSTFPVALRFRILHLIRSRVLMHARLRVGVFANGHTSSNTPDPIRTRKLSGERPGQYWGGGPPGKPLGCCWLFVFSLLAHVAKFRECGIMVAFIYVLSPTAILHRTHPFLKKPLGSIISPL